MRKVVTDDDGSEWSFEIFDANGVDAPSVKPVKQILRTAETHPFFSNDFSTVSGTKAAGQDLAKRTFDTRRTLSREFIKANQQAFATEHANGAKTRPTTRVISEFSNSTTGNDREKIQFPKNLPLTNAHKPMQPARDLSSRKNTSGKPAEEALPPYSFMDYKNTPAVVYTKSESEADRLVQTLKGPLGFDLEWRVMWNPGAQERRTALVQLCDHETILLLQVSSMKRFPRKVMDVIESAHIVKLGVNILNDGEKLFRDFGIRAEGLVELGAIANGADSTFRSIYNREIVSLAKMVAMYLGRTLIKGKVRTSNWEADLTPKMVEYAANDCHCALMVYERLAQIASQAGKTLDVFTLGRPTPAQAKRRHITDSSAPPRIAPKTSSSIPEYIMPEPPRPQQLRAYKLWHVDKMPLEQMCMTLRTGGRIDPLKESTVISYVIGALQADSRLPFDMTALKSLVLMEASSWQRHRQWIASRE